MWESSSISGQTHFFVITMLTAVIVNCKYKVLSLKFIIKLKVYHYVFFMINTKYSSQPGPGCSKLTTLLVNVSLKFQTLISQICQYFLSKTFEKLLHCKSYSHFFNKKFLYIWL